MNLNPWAALAIFILIVSLVLWVIIVWKERQ